ncbi:MAG: hypothetical protein LBU11_07330 [Zoogloeaceae bacterium]|jgi:hypothetical protein|nr:hypothetical protein [Zoogloeaceae bacterium]
MTISTPDPMEFVRQMWGKLGFTMPGMVAPTFNQPDLEKNIADLRAVEGWLRTNLSMLQMTIQGLEMQKTTLSTVEAVGKIMRQTEGQKAAASPGAAEAQASIGETLQRATLWPFNMMQQVQEGLQKHLEGEVKAAADRASAAVDRARAATAAAAAATAASAPNKPAAKPAPRKAAAAKSAKKT